MRVANTATVGLVPTKRRVRFTRTGRAFNPKENERDEEAVEAAFLQANPDFEPFTGRVGLEVIVQRALPKSRPKRVTSEPNTMKPDVDNIVKSVMDALNGVAWVDDKQVVVLHAEKSDMVRKAGDEVHVSVWELQEGEL